MHEAHPNILVLDPIDEESNQALTTNATPAPKNPNNDSKVASQATASHFQLIDE
jgi:hypothetical protein